eukprot:g5728.t1
MIPLNRHAFAFPSIYTRSAKCTFRFGQVLPILFTRHPLVNKTYRMHPLSPLAVPKPDVAEDEQISIGTTIRIMIYTSTFQSHFGPSWLEVMEHISQRLQWTNPRFKPIVTTLDSPVDLQSVNLVLFVGVEDLASSQRVLEGLDPAVVMTLESQSDLKSLISLNGFNPESPSWQERVQWSLPWDSAAKTSKKVYESIKDLWNRQTSDDIVYLIQLLTNQFIIELDYMSNLDPSFESVKCIGKNCREQVFKCLMDPNCRKALQCLGSCGMNDQVCSYRCIVSYESELLEEFSLCILQKHNCLGNSASIPALPDVLPMESFRGKVLSHEMAEDIFIGHKGTVPWSWMVAYGKNPAYDYFPCQFQIFYRGKAKNSMWYDPVFRVITIDGRKVWRRRHYKVRRAKIPGAFYFSVLDNGVTSNEYWRIVDADEELKWALFYYSGAAAAAGISYTGAVLGTFDGNPPPPSQQVRISEALEKCGIKEWELSAVDNSCCENPPL